MPLSAIEVTYQSIFDATDDSISTPPISEEPYEAYFLAWVENSTYLYDWLNMVLPSDEAILEAMIGPKKICEDLHHKSYFLLDMSRIKNSEFHMRLTEGIDQPVNPLHKEGMFFEGNMEKISSTMPINISTKPDVMENVHIGVHSSPEEISSSTT